METFHALLSAAAPAAARGLTQDEARALKGELLIDVTAIKHVYRPGTNTWFSMLEGPLIPEDGLLFWSWQGAASGGTPEATDYQYLNLEGDIPLSPESLGEGLVLEYEAEKEFIYNSFDFDGRPTVWLWCEDNFMLEFYSRVMGGLGLKSFRIYSGTGSPGGQDFWTGFSGCREVV